MKKYDVENFGELVTLFLKTYPEITARGLAKQLNVHESLISQIRKGKTTPRSPVIDRFIDFAIQFSGFEGLNREYVKILAGIIDPPLRRLLAEKVIDAQQNDGFEQWIQRQQIVGANTQIKYEDIQSISVRVEYPGCVEDIEGKVTTPPFIDDQTQEFKAVIFLDVSRYDGARVEFRFKTFPGKFLAVVENRAIVLRSKVKSQLNAAMYLPTDNLGVTIYPEPTPLERFCLRKQNDIEAAVMDAKVTGIGSYDVRDILFAIRRSRNYNPCVHGRAIYEVNSVLYNELKKEAIFKGNDTVTERIGIGFTRQDGPATTHTLSLTVSKNSTEYIPPEDFKEVWETVGSLLESFGIYAMNACHHQLLIDRQVPDSFQISGDSLQLPYAISLLSVHCGIPINKGTAAIGALKGSMVLPMHPKEDKLADKLEALSVSGYERVFIPESNYPQAQRYISEMSVENKLEVIPLRKLEDLFKIQEFAGDRMFFPVERAHAPTYRQIAETKFDWVNFQTISGMFLPVKVIFSNVMEGLESRQIFMDYTPEDTEWVPELAGREEEITRKYEDERRAQGDEINLHDGDLVQLKKITIKSFDGISDPRAIHHVFGHTGFFRYTAQRYTLDKPIAQDREGKPITIRQKYACVGVDIEKTELDLPMSAGFFILNKGRERLSRIGLEYLEELGSGQISQDLTAEFEKNNSPLSQNLIISIRIKDDDWRIIDQDNKRTYDLKRRGDGIDIYEIKEPTEILIAIRSNKLAGYPNSYTSSTACAFPSDDTVTSMIGNPKKYKYVSADEIQDMLARQRFDPPVDQPHIAITVTREMTAEAGIKPEPDLLNFRALILNITDYESTWLGDAQLPDEGYSAFLDEGDEHTLKSIPFTLDSLIPFIVEKVWSPPNLAGLLMTMSAYFGEERVKNAIQQRRLRRMWEINIV